MDYDDVPYEDWARLRGWLRAAFWRTEGFANLKRARDVHWRFHRRHWPEACLSGWMADLEAEQASSPPPRRAHPVATEPTK
jgi:hypothetical protein